MIELVMLGIILVLLVILVVARFTRPTHIRALEKSVTLKKLQLSEKILDSQINGQPNLMDFVEQSAGRPPAQEKDIKPIGYARPRD